MIKTKTNTIICDNGGSFEERTKNKRNTDILKGHKKWLI